MVHKEPDRYKNKARNVILNHALKDLDDIINGHDPEVDTSINNGVWDRLEKMAMEIETIITPSDALLERAIRAALERAAERCDPSSYQAHHAANHSRPTSQAAVPHYQEIADLLRTARLEDEARHAARVEREIQFELET